MVSPTDELIILFASELGRGNVFLVLPEGFSAHGAVKDFDREKSESRSDLDEHQFFDIIGLSELLFMLVDDLIVSEPDSIVEVGEGDHVVDEGL